MQRVLILVGLAAGCGESGLGTRGALAGPWSRGAGTSDVTRAVRTAPPAGLCGSSGICELPASCEVLFAELSGV